MLLGDRGVRLHSIIADRVGSISKLWYVCRALSDNGKATFSISDISNTLEVSERTVRKWLYQGKKGGLFRAYIREKDRVTVYLQSLLHVCINYGISNWGSTAEILVSDLKTLKLQATEITAQALQASSINAAKQKYINSGYKNFFKKLKSPEKIFAMVDSYIESKTDINLDNTPSELCTGVNGFIQITKKLGSVITMLTDYSFLKYGCSQSGIAAKLGRHPSTIKNRLRKSSIKKVRLAITSKDNFIDRELMREEYSTDLGKFFIKDGLLYKLHTYIYEPLHTLTSMRRRRSELNNLSVSQA